MKDRYDFSKAAQGKSPRALEELSRTVAQP